MELCSLPGGPLTAAIATSWVLVEVVKGKEGLRAARAAVIIVLSAAVPVVFDPHSGDVFNLPKYTLTVIGALVLAGLWVVAGVHDGRPRWRNGLQWVVGAVVAWTAISAFTGVDVRVAPRQLRLLRWPIFGGGFRRHPHGGG